MRSGAKTIGLLEHLGNGNLGDDATLDAVMQNIRRRWPHAVIVGLTLNPHDTARRHGIPAYAIWREAKTRRSPYSHERSHPVSIESRLKAALERHHLLFIILRAVYRIVVRAPTAVVQELFFLVESCRIVKALDFLIVCGGGQLLDCWGGPWRFPYALFKWVALAKLACGKCYFLNVGAGPLDHPFSKWLVKNALILADHVSFRDVKSRALIRTIGFSRRAEVLADNVYCLETPAPTARLGKPAGKPIVGISPMAYCHPQRYWDKDEATYSSFVRKFSLFTGRLLQSEHRLIFFTTDIWFDSVAIDDVTRALTDKIDSHSLCGIMRPPISETDELVCQMSRMDYIVTCRFHGVVFAHLMNIPVLALSHHPKIATLMDDLGLSEYCLDIRTFDSDLLMEVFVRLAERREHVKALMADKASDYKHRLTMQFDALFPQITRCGNELA